MTSPEQRAANRANALKSTGPRSEEGKRHASLNATRHRLSLPVDERVFAKEIAEISLLVREDCSSDIQAIELAKRIIDFERNESFLMNFSDEDAKNEIKSWELNPHRSELIQLAQMHRNKQCVSVTFTTPNKKPKGKECAEEIKFIEAFLKLQDNVLLGKLRSAQQSQTSGFRYQKRAINQLIKGVQAIARGEDF